jgi:nitroreductase
MRYQPSRIPAEEAIARGSNFFSHMNSRRSVRFFSDEPVPKECIEIAIQTANTAPSGANQQPWFFAATSDPALKHRIREAAEVEERQNYEGGRMPPSWRKAIAHLGTNSNKEYLDIVPWIVVCFAQKSSTLADGTSQKNYYVNESVGLACGMFIASLHTMGLATLTHTPNPMGFLSEIFERPTTERPYILFPVGYPAADATVPDLERKKLDQILKIYP